MLGDCPGALPDGRICQERGSFFGSNSVARSVGFESWWLEQEARSLQACDARGVVRKFV